MPSLHERLAALETKMNIVIGLSAALLLPVYGMILTAFLGGK
jgi:hypothetical protein